jgi:hypothetical protein
VLVTDPFTGQGSFATVEALLVELLLALDAIELSSMIRNIREQKRFVTQLDPLKLVDRY